jgi:ATP-dependent DNA helicase RecG
MPADLIHQLLGVIQSETQNGFEDSAVANGMQAFLPEWLENAKNNQLSPNLIALVEETFGDYSQSDPQSRAEAVQAFIETIKQRKQNAQSPQDSDPASTNKTPTKEKPLPTSLRRGLGLDAPLTVLHGVGEKNAERLTKLHLSTLDDLLHYYPRRYDDYSKLSTIDQLRNGIETTVIGVVEHVDTKEIPKRKITEALITDSTGWLRLTWFNQPWVERQLTPKSTIVVSGKIDHYLGKPVINNPEWEKLEKEQISTNRIVPVYPLTAHMTQQWLRKIIYKVVDYWAPRTPEYLPATIREAAELLPLTEALQQIHFPDSVDTLHAARERLAFDEIFILQLGLLSQKHLWQEQETEPLAIHQPLVKSFLGSLPFIPTNAQTKVIAEILEDLSANHPMNRLLQGDVGSGKTLVAAAAALVTADNDKQTALMAPTSILAEQHFQSFQTMLCHPELDENSLKPDQIVLLTGDTKKSERQTILENLQNGYIKLIIGTHALIEDPIEFRDLRLVIIDEQHRFGVKQRAALSNKGVNPNLLVMTATPIPRSMALTIYGDLDVSIIDEMPLNRKAVPTKRVSPTDRYKMYQFIEEQIKQGRQAFIIYPLIEQNNREDTKAAVAEHKNLQKNVFPERRLGLLHGRLKPAEKDSIMQKFKNREFDILVSTSVVEVGVDVPNASVMVIEGANRFGLAQLHQFRGRVGRGNAQSYCFLVPETEDELENARLEIICQTNDGFKLADEDLAQRGPGDFLGTRQSGFAHLKIANLTDSKLIEKARRFAKSLIQEDPLLEQEEHRYLKELMEFWWMEKQGETN